MMKKMNFFRILTGTLLPPFLGAALTLLFHFIYEVFLNGKFDIGLNFSSSFLILFYALLAAYFWMGIPSLIYSVIMEYVGGELLRKRDKHFKLKFLGISCLLGVSSISVLLIIFRLYDTILFPLFVINGLVVSFLVGLVLLYGHMFLGKKLICKNHLICEFAI